jgi:hypothetical protein
MRVRYYVQQVRQCKRERGREKILLLYSTTNCFAILPESLHRSVSKSPPGGAFVSGRSPRGYCQNFSRSHSLSIESGTTIQCFLQVSCAQQAEESKEEEKKREKRKREERKRETAPFGLPKIPCLIQVLVAFENQDVNCLYIIHGPIFIEFLTNALTQLLFGKI